MKTRSLRPFPFHVVALGVAIAAFLTGQLILLLLAGLAAWYLWPR